MSRGWRIGVIAEAMGDTRVEARRISIRGLVQGVGFRPFVHNLATAMDLKGFVLNSAQGVEIEVESRDPERLDLFVDRLGSELPPLARIESLTVSQIPNLGFEAFSIRESLDDPAHYVLVSPDIATCADCLREMSDPSDRRFQYPFINCTNCGPRYSIIEDVPYDRPKTTMKTFAMCRACKGEYENPRDRRFHAQPVACPRCGPSLKLVPSTESNQPFSYDALDVETLGHVREMLLDGRVVALRGLGGFHLTCDATHMDAVARLRASKRRSNKPFAVMCRDLDVVRNYCGVSPAEESILQSTRKPICLLPIREGKCGLFSLVAPGNPYLGVMLPYTPLHALLFQEGLEILVMTSGNWSEEPIAASNQEGLERLAPLADAFIFHNREIHMRVDDSVVRAYRGEEHVIRRARGFVPTPIDLGRSVPEILACGGQLKHTFCLTKDRFAILSQHIGDLENLETMHFFMETLQNLRSLYRVNPGLIAHDLHPGYLSTQWAEESEGMTRVGVQHHHAHVVSCMAEHHLEGEVIGVAFDGTGYGEDGVIWGGEILVAKRSRYHRAAHLKYVPLPGGEAAIREPWRMALSHLYSAYGEMPDLKGWDAGVREAKIQGVIRLIQTGLQSPPTSSMGRLFDAVSSIMGLRHMITFEGEAAMEVEFRSDPNASGIYPFDLSTGDPLVVDPSPLVRELWEDLLKGESRPLLGGRFHASVAAMVQEVCEAIRIRVGLNRVCLSGGVFQNWLLLNKTVEALEHKGFQVYVQRQVPPNDGGISLGQAAVAAARSGEG
jgi:hydrogenase maturation protein HypF